MGRAFAPTLIRWILPHLLLLQLSSLSSFALSGAVVSHLPGFQDPLPFHLETGYVTVDEAKGMELFYYFAESEANPVDDPLLLWISGGPGCTSFSAFSYEMGPVRFIPNKYDGSLPRLRYNPYSWTKVANIIFVDSPIGTGFSFAADPLAAYQVGDMSTCSYLYDFLIKWLMEHPKFQSCPLYIAGDSYGGMLTPVVAYLVAEGNKAGKQPQLNLKGYQIGNPFTGELIDFTSRITYAHGVGIISDDFVEEIHKNCQGQDYRYPQTAACEASLNTLTEIVSEIDQSYILEPKCPYASPNPFFLSKQSRSLLEQKHKGLLDPPIAPSPKCKTYPNYLAYFWINNNLTREALHIRKASVGEWQRCNTSIPYTYDIPSSIKYQRILTLGGFRALVYSGDHDLVVPFLGTYTWTKALNFSITDEWRSWHVDQQVAGYTISFANNLTFATVKGAGHTAPQIKPKQCLAMFRRWISNKPL